MDERAMRGARWGALSLLLLTTEPTQAIGDKDTSSSAANMAATSSSAESVPPRWILAVEDTAGLPSRFRTTPLRVTADRMRIGDIVNRCIEREQELRKRIESHEYTLLVNSVMYVGGRDEGARRRLVTRQVDRKFYRKPDREKTIPLHFEQYEISEGVRKEWGLDKDAGAVRITYGDLQELPFYLEDRDDYDFEILSREIVGDRVVYEVRLTPKSDFEIAPTGRIWIDTSSYQILREEFDFEDRVPLPMFVKGVGPFVRERERIGDVWVWKRILIRVDLRMGYLRFLDGDLPDRVEFDLEFLGHRVNEIWSIDAETDEASRE